MPGGSYGARGQVGSWEADQAQAPTHHACPGSRMTTAPSNSHDLTSVTGCHSFSCSSLVIPSAEHRTQRASRAAPRNVRSVMTICWVGAPSVWGSENEHVPEPHTGRGSLIPVFSRNARRSKPRASVVIAVCTARCVCGGTPDACPRDARNPFRFPSIPSTPRRGLYWFRIKPCSKSVNDF